MMSSSKEIQLLSLLSFGKSLSPVDMQVTQTTHLSLEFGSRMYWIQKGTNSESWSFFMSLCYMFQLQLRRWVVLNNFGWKCSSCVHSCSFCLLDKELLSYSK